MPKWTFNISILAATAALLAACAQTQPAAIPTAPAAVAQAAVALATGLPAEASVLLPPTTDPAAPVLPSAAPADQVPEPARISSRPLLDLEPGERLELLADIPIARTDFGVRVAFSPDSRVLLHNGNGLRIQQYDLERGYPLGELSGFEDFSPFTISVSPDGSAVVADDGNRMRIWSNTSGEPVASLELPPVSDVMNAGFHADEFFFVADLHGHVMLWDPRGWAEIPGFTYPGFVEAAVLFPDGSAIALQDWKRKEIGIFDLLGTRLGTLPVAHENDLLLSVSPAGDRLLMHVDYGYPTEGIRIIAVDTGDTLLELPLLNFRYFAVSNDWGLLAAVGVQNELRLYRLPDGQLLLAQPLEVARTLGISMSGDAAYLAFYVFKSGNAGAAIQVWGRGSPGP